MRYAVALADTSHFGRAAELLRISQSGLSQQIKALERALGTALFVRDTRHVTLTPAGHMFVDQSRAVLELADRAEQSVRHLEEGQTGLLRLATNAAGLPQAVTNLLSLYRQRHPNIHVELHPGFSPQNIDALRRRRVDLAIVTVPFESVEPPHFLRLGWIEVLVVVPETHPFALLDEIPRDSLVRQPLLTIPKSVNPILVDHLHQLLFQHRDPAPLIEALDMAPTARFSTIANERGLLGVGFGDEATMQVPGVVFRPIEEPLPRIEYGLVWSDTHASPLVDTLIAVARELPIEP